MGFCLSSLGPAASLGGGQACAWAAVSLEAPTFLCTSAPRVPGLARVLSCRKACLLAGRPAASSLPEPQPFFFVLPSLGSWISGRRWQAGQAAGSGHTAPAEALMTWIFPLSRCYAVCLLYRHFPQLYPRLPSGAEVSLCLKRVLPSYWITVLLACTVGTEKGLACSCHWRCVREGEGLNSWMPLGAPSFWSLAEKATPKCKMWSSFTSWSFSMKESCQDKLLAFSGRVVEKTVIFVFWGFFSLLKGLYGCGIQYSCLENSTDRGAWWGPQELDMT